MGQQIINIPVNWDDEAIERTIDNGVIREIKDKIEKRTLEKLGIEDRYGGHTEFFSDIVSGAVKEVVADNKDYILEEIINRSHRSLVNGKAFKEAKNKLNEKLTKVTYEIENMEV